MKETPNPYAPPRLQIALLFAFFFLVIMAFWCLKPMRTAGVVKAIGPDLYPFVKQGVLLLIPLVMFAYEWLTNRLSRGKLVSVLTAAFAIGCLGFHSLFVFTPTAPVKIAFFFFVDIYATVMVTVFWTYLNSCFDAATSKKIYGVIGSGGLLGGICGASVSGWASALLGVHIILLCCVILGLVLVTVHQLERFPALGSTAPSTPKAKATFWESSTEGIRLVARSPFLLALVGIVGLYEVVSSLIDYQFNASCAAAFSDEFLMAGYQGKVFFVGQLVSLGVMLLVTPFVFKRFGVFGGLLLLPACLGIGSLLFAGFPILSVITLVVGSEMSFAYSINQASKEILYVPLSHLEKTKAKAFIDMFVYRFGKALGAMIVLGFVFWARPRGAGPAHLMAVNALFIVLWTTAIFQVSRQFRKLETKSEPQKIAA